MKKLNIIIIIIIILLLIQCNLAENSNNNDKTDKKTEKEEERNDYREDMRNFVEDISSYARSKYTDFIIIPQNAHDLITKNGEISGLSVISYLNAINGLGREELFYGYEDDDEMVEINRSNSMIVFLDLALAYGKKILVTDYCSTQYKIDDSYSNNNSKGYISFAADSRELDRIPFYPVNPYNENSLNITTLSMARNFLYLINPSNYDSKSDFLNAIRQTNYDMVIIDLFFDDTKELTAEDVLSLKTKQNGGTRLIIAYMSIGEAEAYRYYWQPEWEKKPPLWLIEENPDWPENYKVKYWDKQWQEIIYGNDNSYLRKILNAGFDGVYLDLVDAYEYFE